MILGLFIRSFCFLTVVFSLSFAQAKVPNQVQRAQSYLEGILASINTLTSSDNTCETHMDCKVMVTAEHSCGLPASFTVVSTKNKHFSAVEALTVLSINARHEMSELSPLLKSMCYVTSLPNTSCQKNICVVNGSSGN